MKRFFMIFVMLAGFCFAGTAPAFAAKPYNLLEHCDEPCIVIDNEGGIVADFLAAVNAVRAGARKQVIIAGRCISACVLFADQVRPHVCIVPSASFAFHKGVDWSEKNERGETILRFVDIHWHSRDILRWVKSKGGFPISRKADYSDALWMHFNVARRFFPVCSSAQVPLS